MLLKTATSVYENRNVLANIMKLKLCTLLEAGLMCSLTPFCQIENTEKQCSEAVLLCRLDWLGAKHRHTACIDTGV